MASRTTEWRRGRGIGTPTPKGSPDYDLVAAAELTELDAPAFVVKRLAEELVSWVEARERARWSATHRGRKDPGSVGERRFRARCRAVVARESRTPCWSAGAESYWGAAKYLLWSRYQRLALTEGREAWAEIRCLVAEIEAEQRPVTVRCFLNELHRRFRRLERVCGLRTPHHRLPVQAGRLEDATAETGPLPDVVALNMGAILGAVREAVGDEVFESAIAGDPDAIEIIREKLGVNKDGV